MDQENSGNQSEEKPAAEDTAEKHVLLVKVDDMEQAEEYKTLLEVNDIPVSIADEGEKGIAIMVPEEFVDDAYIVIESQDAYDDFYDFAPDEEEDDDLGGDLFEDDF